MEEAVTQDLRMDLRHAVDRGRDIDRKVRHVHCIIFDNEEVGVRMLLTKSGVNADDDVADLGHDGTQ